MNGVSYDDAATPDGIRIYAIGDIHGRADCLADLLAKIDAEIARDKPEDWRVICLGDYVDRGPESARVLEMLSARVGADPRNIALKGNHDEVFVRFLSDPTNWHQFADFDGATTARSYGVRIEFLNDAEVRRVHRALLAQVPPIHLAFLNGLRLSVSFGDFYFCHAGIRPGVPLDDQIKDDLLWIRREFHDHAGLYPKFIVHGHTPHEEPEIRTNRVNLDTWAFSTGRLTAMVMEGRTKRFLDTGRNYSNATTP